MGPGPVNTNWGPGVVNTNWRPRPVNTNWGPRPVNTNLGPRPVNISWGPGPGAKQRIGGWEIQRPFWNIMFTNYWSLLHLSAFNFKRPAFILRKIPVFVWKNNFTQKNKEKQTRKKIRMKQEGGSLFLTTPFSRI